MVKKLLKVLKKKVGVKEKKVKKPRRPRAMKEQLVGRLVPRKPKLRLLYPRQTQPIEKMLTG